MITPPAPNMVGYRDRPHASRLTNAILAAGAIITSLLAIDSGTAAVTPYSWIRAGEAGIFTDSSGNAKNFNAAFSSGCAGGAGGGGNPAAVIAPTAAGGPLGTTGVSSTACTRWGFFSCSNSGMWIQGSNTVPPPELWSLPATDWVMEAWVLPVGTGGSNGGANSQLVSTGSGQFGGTPGGVAIRSVFNGDETMTITAEALGGNAHIIGDPVIIDTKRWVHLAVVNDNGVTTFYKNGVASGSPSNDVSPPSGVPYIGSGQDTGAPFDGYLDEVRFSTFDAGTFVVGDLLLRPPGPNILAQPQAAEVWDGGPAPFEVRIAFDAETTYQWKVGGADIPGATGGELFLPAVSPADSGKSFNVVINNEGIERPSAAAGLTVVPKETANVAYYRSAVQAETSLVAYFPVDGDTGLSVTNAADATAHGALASNTSYDGRTDRSLGERALRFKGDREAVIPSNADYEFGATGGTIEAIVFMARGGPPGNATIFSLATDPTFAYYQVQASPDGSSLIYRNDLMPLPLSWPVPRSLLDRFAHVAMVFSGDGNITAYVDGESLGTRLSPGFGSATGLPANIGSSGSAQAAWNGTIDELAIYGSALPATTIAIHNSRFVFGTAETAPTITSQPTGAKSLLAGGTPVFRVTATGTAPLSYQWKLNGAPITGNSTALTASLMLNNSTAAMSGDYTVTVTNPAGNDTSDPFTVNFTPPPDPYGSFVMSDNPSAYWRLNETSGTVLKDSAGGLDGTYSATVDLGEPGAPWFQNTAAHFDGAGTPVPNAVVPFSPTLNPSTEFTLEFWVKPDISGQINRAVLASQNRDTGRAGYAIYQGLNGNFWEAHLGFGDVVIAIGSQVSPQQDRWDHVVVTWNGVDTARIYVNGIDDTAPDSDVGGPTRPNLAVPLEIGSRFGGGIPYQGTIDEVAFYNHALTPEQVARHWNITAPQIGTLNTPVFSNGQVTITWNGSGILQESTTFVNWTAVPGNPTSPYITPATGNKFFRLAQ